VTRPQTLSGTRLERALLVAMLLAMVVLPTVQAIARRFGEEMTVAAVLTRHLTFWVGFFGALLATASRQHLSLSTLELIPQGRLREGARILGQMVSTAVTALLAYAAFRLVQADQESGKILVGSIPVVWSEAVMPVALALMALRFAWTSPGGWPGRVACVLAAGVAFLPGLSETATWAFWPMALLVGVAFLLGAPVFVAMGGLAMLFFFKDGVPIATVPTESFRLVESPALPAIPLFTMAGYLLAEGGAAQRLVRAYRGIFGWMPGGLAVMVTFVCAIFTTFTGGSGVTILALGGLLLPSLLAEKYPEGFSVGLVTAAGSLGLLFPPSPPVILYSVFAGTPSDLLFIGGFIPGMLMIVIVAAYGVVIGVRSGAPRQPFDGREALRAIWGVKWDLGLPILVGVAVVSGFATVVEASAMAAAYALAVEILIFRDVHPVKQMPTVFAHAATLVGAVIILLGVALGLTNYMVDAEIPTRLVDWVTQQVKSPAVFLLALNLILLVLGSVFEIYAAIIVLAPLVAPLGAAYGIDPIHLGVVFLANLELGFLFPPMGLNLFLAASRFEKPLPYLYKKALPFLLVMAVGVLIITYVPAVTTGIVRLVKG
jgi:tripartite ATP-independent transporter DctM subunit